jgi:hypothetical protein
VRYPISIYGADIEAPLRSGKPPFDANKMEPLMPDRAGVKTSLGTLALLIIRLLPTLPRIFASRPSVVDPRIHEAGVPSPYANLPLCANLDYTVHQED